MNRFRPVIKRSSISLVLGLLGVSPAGAQGRQPIPVVRSAIFSGTSCLSLEDVAQSMNGYLHWYPVSERVDLLFRSHEVRFFLGSDRAWVDGQPARLAGPAVRDREGVWVPSSFFQQGPLSRDFRRRIDWPVPTAAVLPASPSAPAARSRAPLPPLNRPLRPVTVSVPSTPSRPLPAMPPPVRIAHAIRRIVIDPGHGGIDPGAIGAHGTEEKTINLLMANDLADTLRAEGYQVLLTRTDDRFIPLADRAALANRYRADLFISLHCNASLSSRLKGFSVYFLSEKASDPHAGAVAQFENSSLKLEGKSPRAMRQVERLLSSLTKNADINSASELSTLIDRQAVRALREPDLGVQQAAFYVLRGAEMPAILVEAAFLTNPAEETLLQRESFRQKLVQAIAQGIGEYDRRLQEKK